MFWVFAGASDRPAGSTRTRVFGTALALYGKPGRVLPLESGFSPSRAPDEVVNLETGLNPKPLLA